MPKKEPSPEEKCSFLQRMLELKREGNPFLKIESWRLWVRELGLSLEQLGTTEEEVQELARQDWRWQIENDLENWRMTASIGHPESVFAQGVVDALEKGGWKPQEFGIDDKEMEEIKRSAGP